MPKYRVILTRDITESTTVIVEAPHAIEAEQRAIDKSGRYGGGVKGWALDDNCFSDVYPTDVTMLEDDND